MSSSDDSCAAIASGYLNCDPAGRIASWASCAFFTLPRYERGASGRNSAPKRDRISDRAALTASDERFVESVRM